MDRFRAALSAIGAVLTGAGVLILLFVAYQLWGTGLFTSRQQDSLKSQFQARAAEPPSLSSTTTTNPLAVPPPPPTGEAVAIIRIPKLAIDQAVVEGTGLADLRKGPGHYPSTPMPGELGNAAIAGHRTTYGAPFNRLDELSSGDEVLVTTLKGSFTYKVEGSKVVRPNQVEVLDPSPDAKLTLTTCNPKYSAAQRLVVVAGLVPGETAAAKPPPTTTTSAPRNGEVALEDSLDAGLASDRSKLSTTLWGIGTALVGAAWWWAVHRRRHWTRYLAGVLPFLVALFFFYAHLELLLPANF